MSVEYTPRTGKRYYLHVKTTKAGNPSYFFSTKPEGQRVVAIPAGYEIYENVNGQVFLRKKTEPVILPEELGVVERLLRKREDAWRYCAEVKKNAIIVHQAGEMAGIDSIMSKLGRGKMADSDKLRYANFMAMLRFTLIDKKARVFVADRFCFRGSVDDWIPIAGPDTLAAHVRKFMKHLGRESFYNLY